MADYQQNFMNALHGGLQFGQQVKGIQDQRQLGQLAGQAYGAPRDQRQSLLGQLAQISPEAAQAQSKQWSADDENDQQELVNMARFIKAAPPEQQMQVYQSSVLPKLRERGMQAPDWTPETQQTILQTVDALVNAYAGGQQGVGVQSTFIDDQGNRVAILRDGTTQILGRNAPSTQIIEGEGGFYGVNKGNLRAAPVLLGGGGMSLPTEDGSEVRVQEVRGPNGEVYRVEVGDQAAMGVGAAESGIGGPASAVELPRRDLSPAQYAQGPQQLRPAPKAATAPSGYSVNPDGTMTAIPGGPADVARQAREDAAAARKAAEDVKTQAKTQESRQRQMESAQTAQDLIGAIDQLTASPGFDSLGTTWGDAQIMTPFVRNDAKDAQGQLRNIASQVAMATLARLKSLSATGATGFGALSNQELTLIQNAISNLQSEDISNAELRRSLKTIRDKMAQVADWQPTQGGYQVGQVIQGQDGKRYRITDLSDPNDPDVEEVR